MHIHNSQDTGRFDLIFLLCENMFKLHCDISEVHKHRREKCAVSTVFCFVVVVVLIEMLLIFSRDLHGS